jgi:hypothetical protein
MDYFANSSVAYDVIAAMLVACVAAGEKNTNICFILAAMQATMLVVVDKIFLIMVAAFVYGTHMTAISLSSHSLGNDCN